MDDEVKKVISSLARRCGNEHSPDGALKLSQSALNLAHVLSVLSLVKPAGNVSEGAG